MGSLKVGDKIIVTYAIIPSVENEVGVIVEVNDCSSINILPYRIKLNDNDADSRLFWVDGIPHSPLMEELF